MEEEFEELFNSFDGFCAESIIFRRFVNSNNFNSSYKFYPLIQLLKNENNVDDFINSELPWYYLIKVNVLNVIINLPKINSTHLADHKLEGLVDHSLYISLALLCEDELPINFINHYANVDDSLHKIFWNEKLTNIYSEYYKFNPLLRIKHIYDNSQIISRLMPYDKSTYVMIIREIIKMNGILPTFSTRPLPKTIGELRESNEIKKPSSTRKKLFELVETEEEISEYQILNELWKIIKKEDIDNCIYLVIADYFNWMSLDEQILWWNHIKDKDVNSFVAQSRSEIFIEYANPDYLSLIDGNSSSTFVKMASVKYRDELIKMAVNKFPGHLYVLHPTIIAEEVRNLMEITT